MGDDESFQQLTFQGGDLVPESEAPAWSQSPVEPNEEAGYWIEIKPGALEVNRDLVAVRDEHGDVLSFGSRAKAEAFASRVSAADGNVRVQAAAPNDPAEVDGYLLADHDPAITEPATVDGETLRFDVGPNHYGALGEALIKEGANSPALRHFVEEDLADREVTADVRIHVTDGGFVQTSDSTQSFTGWMPDCRVEARDGWDGPVIETYYCEIKTGNASFERSQVEAMEAMAREERVLKVRVLIDDLPSQYGVRFSEVSPAGE